jgi:hypothetical protein
MTRPEQGLTEAAVKALMGANTQSGALPQGTPEDIVKELRERGLISRTAMSIRGRAARGRLLHAALEEM